MLTVINLKDPNDRTIRLDEPEEILNGDSDSIDSSSRTLQNLESF
jgi:hypothetical protein